MRAFALAVLAALAFTAPALFSGPALAAQAQRTYAPATARCDGWPRAPIGMAPGFCAGIVLAPAADAFRVRTIRMPRTLLQLGPDDWLVADLGDWGSDRGAVFRLTAKRGAPVRLKRLLSHLQMPHRLGRGPDGKIYVGEMNRISRFDPDAAEPQKTMQAVVDDLPANALHSYMHPLSQFIFDSDGALLVNIGAPTDRCATADNKPDGTRACRQSEGALMTAGVRRYAYLGKGAWDPAFSVLARGLRNAMGLVRHASGTLLEADNGNDFPDADEPADELNVLLPGGHYGWPYCYDMDKQVPLWARLGAMDCTSAAHSKPALLLPPHVAPLDLVYYDGALFPALRGKLLSSWHSDRVGTGSRLVAFTVDARGVPVPTPKARYAALHKGAVVMKPYEGPASEPFVLTPAWEARAGVRPSGAPVGIAIAADGAIWIAEDRNGAILRIAPDRP